MRCSKYNKDMQDEPSLVQEKMCLKNNVSFEQAQEPMFTI